VQESLTKTIEENVFYYLCSKIKVHILLFNHSNDDFISKLLRLIIFFLVNYGDRIAQLIIEKITQTHIIEVESLEETERGDGGFGSTGVSLDDKIIKNA